MKIFHILLILIIGFIANIILYYFSTSYSSFLKSFKGESEVVLQNDDFKVNIAGEDTELLPSNTNVSLEEQLDEQISVFSNKNNPLEKINFVEKNDDENIVMTESDQSILRLFSEYSLTKLENKSLLFDLTEEYPDSYFEYYNLDITLLFFSTQTYEGVRDIFNAVSSKDLFTINELDNFGQESFYINLANGYDDGYVRLIIRSNGSVFGLKISKNEYTNVKEILNNL